MEQMENYMRIIIGIALTLSLIIIFKNKLKRQWFLKVLLLIIAIKVLDIFLLKLVVIENVIEIISANVLLAPISYLYFIGLTRDRVTWATTIFHLTLPFIITIVSFYNMYFSSQENIMITILLNLISSIVVLIYGILILFKSHSFYIGVARNIKKSLYVFLIFICLFLVIESLVSIISGLYFSDNLFLVNLSVNIPKIYETHFYFLVLSLMSIGSIYHSWAKVKAK